MKGEGYKQPHQIDKNDLIIAAKEAIKTFETHTEWRVLSKAMLKLTKVLKK